VQGDEARARGSTRPPRFALGLGAIAVTGFVLRAFYAATRGSFRPITDPSYYHLQANLIADGRGFIDPFTWAFQGDAVPTAAHPPLFTLVLATGSAAGATSPLSHRLIGCLIGTATIVVLGLLGRRIGGPAVGLLTAALAAASPNLWVFDAGVFAESLELLLVALLLLAVYRIPAHPRWSDAVVLGTLIGLLGLTRSELLLFVPLLVVPALLGRQATEWRRGAALALVGCVVTAVVIAPWVIRNESTFSAPVTMSTNGDLFVAYTNCARAYSGPGLGWFDVSCAPRSTFADRTTDEAERMAEARRHGLEYARAHTSRLFGVVVWARAARLWNVYRPVQTAELASLEDRPKGVSLLGMAFFAVTVPFAVGGAFMLRRRRTRTWPLVVPLVVATFTAMAFSGNVRFRAVAEPSILVLAAVGVVALVDRYRSTAVNVSLASPGDPRPDRTR
jgi:4-amino-4-deoxy-L-arabinose transferase-like glycosyltransferase